MHVAWLLENWFSGSFFIKEHVNLWKQLVFKIVLGDIAREKAAVEKELSKGVSVVIIFDTNSKFIFSNYSLIHQVSGGGAGLDRILFHSLKQKLTNQV